jgi:hypothetical protein
LSTHDPLDQLCASGAPLIMPPVIEIRNEAELRGDADLVRRCDAVLESLNWTARQERGRAA